MDMESARAKAKAKANDNDDKISLCLLFEGLHVAAVQGAFPAAAAKAAAAATTTTPTPTPTPTVILVPNVQRGQSVELGIKKFVESSLGIPIERQLVRAPLYTRLADDVCVEDVYSAYDCRVDSAQPEVHVDDETFAIWARQKGRSCLLDNGVTLRDYHLLHRCRLRLKALPENLSDQGGRVFVNTKDGMIPFVGVTPLTKVLELKQRIEEMTMIPSSRQILSSVGRVMHDEFRMKDYDGFHAIYESSVIDLCKSGDNNMEQAHRRMIVFLKAENQQLTVLVQPSDTVRILMQIVESNLGIPKWRQRLSLSGKSLLETRSLAEYFIFPECTIDVRAATIPIRTEPKETDQLQSKEEEENADHVKPEAKPAARKLKLVRIHSGHVLETFTIPVLTSDKVADLKRKIKRSLRPLISTEKQTASTLTSISSKPPVPDFSERQKSTRASSGFQTPPKSLPRSSSLKSPMFFTPDENKEQFSTPPTRADSPSVASPKATESVKFFLARKLNFGSSSFGFAPNQSSSNQRQPCSPLRRIFPQTKPSVENQLSVQEHLQKVTASQHGSENYHENGSRSLATLANSNGRKSSFSTWFQEKLPNLKGQHKDAFTEK